MKGIVVDGVSCGGEMGQTSWILRVGVSAMWRKKVKKETLEIFRGLRSLSP